MLHEATLKNAPPFFLGSVVRLLLEANHLHERRGRGKSRAKKKRLRRKGGGKKGKEKIPPFFSVSLLSSFFQFPRLNRATHILMKVYRFTAMLRITYRYKLGDSILPTH